MPNISCAITLAALRTKMRRPPNSSLRRLLPRSDKHSRVDRRTLARLQGLVEPQSHAGALESPDLCGHKALFPGLIVCPCFISAYSGTRNWFHFCPHRTPDSHRLERLCADCGATAMTSPSLDRRLSRTPISS